mmetsp:Transcript_12004/g.19918  ORF Transcript_12004/g.19918 Transcript_12004/m.19918 type:complete len:93 (+) Transcript_12004:157-435(+)
MQTDNNHTKNQKDECVGTLLVHANDVQELSTVPTSRDECVGTLLVHQADVQELSSVPVSNLTRRVTEKVKEVIENTEHIDPDDDILYWQCES